MGYLVCEHRGPRGCWLLLLLNALAGYACATARYVFFLTTTFQLGSIRWLLAALVLLLGCESGGGYGG